MYKSCHLTYHGLCFYHNEVVVCCYSPNEQVKGGEAPSLFKNYRGEIIPKEQLFERMKKYSSQFKAGNIPVECEGCFQIKEADWDEDEYIDFVTITHYSCCNADCIYCSNNLEVAERTNDKYEVLPFLRYLKNEGVLRQNCELHIGGGEFTIYKECEDILEEFGANGFAKIYVATNSIKYSQGLYNALKSGSANVVISLDSGCRETFKKVKRIDAFDTVIKNINKYAEANNYNICLKYILIPGVNDNMSEYNKFLEIAKNAKANIIRLDIEGRYLRKVENNINPYYFEMAEEMRMKALDMGFDTDYHAFMQQPITKGIEKKSLKNFIDFCKLKYLHTAVKDLYTTHKYYT